MGLKLLHSADWHLGSPFGSFSEAQRLLLRRQQLTIPDKIADVCLREDCDLMLLAGDIFDGEPRREWVDAVKRALARCAVPVFIAPGNHDFCRPGSPWLEESWPENVHIFTGGLESVAVQNLNCRIWGAAFQSMDCPPLLEGFRADCREDYAIALLHGDPVQASSPCNPVTSAQVRYSALNYLALGHIHKDGSFRAGSTLCGWPGCPMGRGWDETGDKGVYLVTLEGDCAEIRSISLDLPCFREETADIAGDARGTLESLLPPVPSFDFYRITLTGCGSTDIPALLHTFSHVPNLELIDRTMTEADIWGSEGSDTLEGTYFRLLRQQLADADPETVRRIRLAAEISRSLLEGRSVTLP
ncbi:MAG: metallophosphoesterase [Oscillospiraceae bacterium]|nr:metallophosphoesterase [Oscillospiraceae bacterium]